jgi:hypothetical protein
MSASPDGIAGDIAFLSALRPVSYAMIPVKSLAFPEGLFDGTSADPPAPLDPMLPIIAARTAAKGPFTVIDGCKRLKRFAESGAETCACGLFDGILGEKPIGLARIFLNQKRQMRIRESIGFFRWLSGRYQGADLDTMLKAVGFEPSFRPEIEPLAACSDDMVRAIDEGRLLVRGAAELCQWEDRDRRAFLECFRGLSLSAQTQREFIEWLPEIAFEKKETVAGVLQSKKILGIIGNGVLNNPQKIEAVRAFLYSLKFPLFEEAMEQWKKTAAATSRLALENEPSSKVVFMPSPAFEMNKLEIRITINHAPAAQSIFRKLAEVPQRTWSQLMYPM